MVKNRSQMVIAAHRANFSQKRRYDFFFKSHEKNPMITSLSSENAIFIESPKAGQNGQFRAKSADLQIIVKFVKNEVIDFL